MIRQAGLLAIIGLVLLPDWATAFGRRWVLCPPLVPVVACPPRVVLLPPCLQTFDVYPAAPLAAPAVHREPAPADAPRTDPEPAPPKPVAPGSPVGPGRSAADPPAGADPRPAEFAIPARPAPSPPPRPRLPVAQPDPAAGATAPPSPAAPKDPDAAKIPPLVPRLPGKVEPGLPPLTLPSPGGEPGTSTSRYSPLAGRPPAADVIPVDGPPPATPTANRKVGFFNHTDRDIKLTVNGETVTLPKRHYVAAEVPQAFAWKMDDGAVQTTTVPTAAPGVEVVIRR